MCRLSTCSCAIIIFLLPGLFSNAAEPRGDKGPMPSLPLLRKEINV